MYPLKFKKVFIEKVWGGREFESSLNMEIPFNKKIGESWEVSAHKNGMSIVENGIYKDKTLEELYFKFGEKLVGEKIYKKYKDRFPLLIKYLDINDRLSIQVHPSDEVALKKHNEFGKSESWYIINASDDAKLIMGMKEGITKEIFLEKSNKNDFEGLFEEISVKKGDLIDINPGMVHASLKGSILLAEIQQNSDITYRIYDFDRIENGKKRELHLDDAANVIDFSGKARIINTDFDENKNFKKLISKEYYNIDKVKIEVKMNDINENSFLIYSILEGNAEVNYNYLDKNESISIKKGETLFIPANVSVEIEGKVEFLRTYIST